MRPSDERRPRRPRSERLAHGSLAIATAAAPLLFGGALGWTVPVLTAMAGLTALTTAWAGWRAGRPLPHGILLIALVVAALWTTLQAIPIPCGLAEWIAPESAEHTARTAALFSVEPRCTLTEDPGRTREEILKGLALVSFFVSASFVSAIGKRDTVLRTVAFACTATAAAAMGHMVLAAHSIWGVYTPTHGSALLGPFVNPNHLGGLMTLGAPVCFGLATSSRHRDHRTPWALAGLLMLGVIALTRSRGAILAVLLGLMLFGALHAREHARRARSDGRTALDRLLLRPAVMALLPVLCGVGVIAGAAGLETFVREIGDTDHSKLQVALRSLSLAVTGPWVGVGRGAFAVAYVERAETGRVRFEHAENVLAQWAVDWGIVVGPLLALAIGFVVVRAVVRADRPHLYGGLAGFVGYAIQNFVDFGSEMLGSVGVAAVLLAGAATGHVSSSVSDPLAVRRSVALAATTGALTLLAVAILGPTAHGRRVEVARASLESALASDDRQAFAEAVREAATAHPREPAFPLLAGAEAARHGEPRALAYLNRAMSLAPAWVSPRVVAARYLARHGHFDQALLEMREALERDPTLVGAEACTLLQARPTAETLLRMAARNTHRTESLIALVGCLPSDAENADAVDLALLESEPALVEPLVRLVERAVRQGRLEDARLRAGDWTDHEAAALTLARARLELAAGEPTRAAESAARAEERLVDPWPAVVLRARAAASEGDLARARDTVGELRGLAGPDATRLGEAEILLGELETQGGNRGRALAAYESAWRGFERLDALVQVAALANALHDEPRAIAARRTLCERNVREYCTSVP
ncbi:MAG: O-antigen ligase family protein [Deltaproteobacteria bacterium]